MNPTSQTYRLEPALARPLAQLWCTLPLVFVAITQRFQAVC